MRYFFWFLKQIFIFKIHDIAIFAPKKDTA